MATSGNLSLTSACERAWDVLVVGAGPAGATCAYQLATAGQRVLLVERSRHPRWKVCGGCLSALGVETLRSIGLGGVLEGGAAPKVTRTVLRAGARRLDLRMGTMVAVSREALDAGLTACAIDAGVDWLDGVVAEIGAEAAGAGLVKLRRGDEVGCARAGVIVDARGLRPSGGTRAGRIGLGATVDEGGRCPGAHELTMCVGQGGYIGRVRLGDGRMNWGAAVDPRLTREFGAVQALARLWESCGLDACELPTSWRGTPRLSQRRTAQEGRIVRIGDAGGYVEPITGEGMSWAIASGVACAEAIADGGVARGEWGARSARLLGRRKRRCALVSRAVRAPAAVGACLAAGALMPALSGSLARLSIGDRGYAS